MFARGITGSANRLTHTVEAVFAKKNDYTVTNSIAIIYMYDRERLSERERQKGQEDMK